MLEGSILPSEVRLTVVAETVFSKLKVAPPLFAVSVTVLAEMAPFVVTDDALSALTRKVPVLLLAAPDRVTVPLAVSAMFTDPLLALADNLAADSKT
jgi:hypothetical protein